ncbi:MAG: GDP-mannose 4,6-dehydratase [Candidatus Aenigmarchaeota archaeon]|nr:GDP-mannose 4,6-dehydratase [Candidatus Aenigmarchaeota archaeon]MDI6722119.1 GDP-mannose 4,6-dehydratase [Candidatus Aenigmarchaeota archaeon]
MAGLDFWKGKNVFITGATGFIGSHLASALCERADVTILKRDHVRNSFLELSGSSDKINAARGDLEDLDAVMRAIAEYEIDTVFHIGAQPIVNISRIEPLKTFESNIKGTWNVLEACRLVSYESKRIEKIIVASSDKSYGSQAPPYTEDMHLGGESPYDVSKACADMIAQSYFKNYSLPVCISRLGNVFGPGDINFNRIIPGTIKSIIKNEDIVIRSDGSCVREYFYVKDAVNAYLVLAENMVRKEILGHAFNFGSGEKMSVLDIVNKISGFMGCKKSPKIMNSAKNEIQTQFLSTEKAKRLLKWTPSYTFKQALPETVAWYREFFGERHE